MAFSIFFQLFFKLSRLYLITRQLKLDKQLWQKEDQMEICPAIEQHKIEYCI